MRNIILLLILFMFCSTINAQKQTTIYVNTPAELITAIRSNSKIIIKEGIYNISEDSTYCNLSPYYKKVKTYWDNIYRIENLVNVTIIGKGKVDILINDPDKYVLDFINCDRISIQNVYLGHDTEGNCSGGVIRMDSCENFNLSNVKLYGSGTTGVYVDNSKNIVLKDSRIFKCTHHVANFFNSKDILLKNVQMDSCKGINLFEISDCTNLVFEKCNIKNNNLTYYDKSVPAIDIDECNTPIAFKQCNFENNCYSNLSYYPNCLLFNKCNFRDNGFGIPPIHNQFNPTTKKRILYMEEK